MPDSADVSRCRPYVVAFLASTLIASTGACALGPDDTVGARPSPRATSVALEQFGAVGDGRHDDTLAIQTALDALAPGQTLIVSDGRAYRHSSTLHVRRDGVRIVGPGTLLATNEKSSSISLEADNVTLEGNLVLQMAATTQRWSGSQQMKVLLDGTSGTVLHDVTIDGSAAAGIYIGHADDFTLIDVAVRNTRADGIHITDGSHDGQLVRPHVTRAGDDGVAVVSYSSDGSPVRNISVESPIVEDGQGGRGISVVGGDEITFRNVNVTKSWAAAVYVAAEGSPYDTFAPTGVRVLGGSLTASNTNEGIEHGAVMIFSGRPGYTIDDVQVDGLTIMDTRPSAPWQIGLLGPGGFDEISLTNIAVSTGPVPILVSQAGQGLTTSGIVVKGNP